jgi:predicted metal-dependent hydrolase
MNHGSSHNAPSSQPPEPAYAGFFDCFNCGDYFEAHEVLESLWLRVRAEPVGDFYKGLIQIAGAFVHLQKGRLPPAVSLFRLADGYLAKYPVVFEGLDVSATRCLIQYWQAGTESSEGNPLRRWPLPRLALLDRDQAGGISVQR